MKRVLSYIENIQINRFLLPFSMLVLLFQIISIFMVLNRGFDFADEGYYILGYQANQEIFSANTYFWLIIRKFFSFIQLNISNLRIINFILISTSSLFYSVSLSKLLKTHNNITVVFKSKLIFSTLLIATLNSYSYFPNSLSYYNLTVFLMQIYFGFLFLHNAHDSSSIKLIKYSYLLFAGIALGVLFFIKITTSLILIALTICYLLLSKFRTAKAYSTSQIGCLLFGVILSFLFYFIFIQDVSAYYNGMLKAVVFYSNANSGHTLDVQFAYIIKFLAQISGIFGVSLVFLMIREITSRNIFINKRF